jgi:hypothetical protein
MARMRIISEAYNQLKQDDPNTALTISSLRRLINSNIIPTVKVGRKILLDYDLLLQYLSSPTERIANIKQGQIRRVN